MMITQRSLAIAIASLALVAAGCDGPSTSDTARSGGTLQKSPSDYSAQTRPSDSSSLQKGTSSLESAAAKAGEAVDKAAAAIDDATVTAKVKAALIAEPGLKTMQIDVETHDGVVTLAGNVDSRSHGERAVQLANGTTGVRQVIDRLVVAAS